MDRRSFLSGTISAAAAGMVTLATDADVAAFASGDRAVLSHAPALGYAARASAPIGQLVYIQDEHEMYVPLGTLHEVQIRNEPRDVTSWGDTNIRLAPDYWAEARYTVVGTLPLPSALRRF